MTAGMVAQATTHVSTCSTHSPDGATPVQGGDAAPADTLPPLSVTYCCWLLLLAAVPPLCRLVVKEEAPPSQALLATDAGGVLLLGLLLPGGGSKRLALYRLGE
jgi:hypothetical protein